MRLLIYLWKTTDSVHWRCAASKPSKSRPQPACAALRHSSRTELMAIHQLFAFAQAYCTTVQRGGVQSISHTSFPVYRVWSLVLLHLLLSVQFVTVMACEAGGFEQAAEGKHWVLSSPPLICFCPVSGIASVMGIRETWGSSKPAGKSSRGKKARQSPGLSCCCCCCCL